MNNENDVTIEVPIDDMGWWQEMLEDSGMSDAELFTAMLNAYVEKKMAVAHPDQAKALKAFDAWAAQVRSLVSGVIVQADDLVQKAVDEGEARLADAMARIAVVEAERDDARDVAKAAADEAGAAKAALKKAEAEWYKAEAERDAFRAEVEALREQLRKDERQQS